MKRMFLNLLSMVSYLIFLSCNNSNSSANMSADHSFKQDSPVSKLDSVLQTGWYYVSDSSNVYKRQLDKTEEFYFIIPEPIVTVHNFKQLEIRENEYGGKKYLWLKMPLDDEGTKAWSIATGNSIGKHLAFILDNKLIFLPIVNAQIDGGMTALNRENETRETLENIKTIIEREKQ